MPHDFTKIEKVIPDPLVEYLCKKFDEARFDTMLADGTLWCSDSNASLDPQQIAKDIREILNAPSV